MTAMFAVLSAPSSTNPLCHMRTFQHMHGHPKRTSCASEAQQQSAKNISSPPSRLAPIKHSHNLTPRNLNTAINHHAACRYNERAALADMFHIHSPRH